MIIMNDVNPLTTVVTDWVDMCFSSMLIKTTSVFGYSLNDGLQSMCQYIVNGNTSKNKNTNNSDSVNHILVVPTDGQKHKMFTRATDADGKTMAIALTRDMVHMSMGSDLDQTGTYTTTGAMENASDTSQKVTNDPNRLASPKAVHNWKNCFGCSFYLS